MTSKALQLVYVNFITVCFTLATKRDLAFMHLSLSIPTYPRSDNRWGFVVICQHPLSPGRGICPRISIVFGIPIQNVGDLQHKIVPRDGEFVKRLSQIPNNPYPCPTWGRGGGVCVTMIGALYATGHNFRQCTECSMCNYVMTVSRLISDITQGGGKIRVRGEESNM